MKLTFLSLLTALSLSASAPAEDGWTSLFNGKDLSGWKSNAATDEKNENGNSFHRRKWRTQGQRRPRAPLLRRPRRRRQVQELRGQAKVKTTAGSNSGFYIHTKYQDTNWPMLATSAR